jgi:hypothetical protein
MPSRAPLSFMRMIQAPTNDWNELRGWVPANPLLSCSRSCIAREQESTQSECERASVRERTAAGESGTSWEAGHQRRTRSRHHGQKSTALRRDETHGAVGSVLAVALDAARRRRASRLSPRAASLPGPLDCRTLAHLVETRHKRVVVLPQSDVFVWLFFLESENRTGRGTVTRTDTVTTGRVSIHSKVVTPSARRTYHPDLGPAMGVQLDDNVPNLRRHATEVPLGLLALPGWHKA